MHSELRVEEGAKEDLDAGCFLTHSLKEELEEMNEIVVLFVRPEQKR